MLGETQEDFLSIAAKAAVTAENITGCPAELSVAQAILESGWGLRMPCNNIFGIKHTSGPDNYQITHEFLDGTWRQIRLDFQAYDSVGDCFTAHARLLTEGQRYAAAWERYRSDPSHDLDTLISNIAPIYATDPAYGAEVIALAHGGHVTLAIAQARSEWTGAS